jgi:hypothetical protein
MSRLLLFVLAAIALGACENRTTAGVGSPIAYADSVFVPGFGRVEARVERSAAAGGSSASGSQELQLRMDDGTSQRVQVPGADFRVGDRVRVTREGHVVRMNP